MKTVESLKLQWIVPASLAAAWGISLSIQQTIEGSITSIVGLATLFLIIYAITQGEANVRVFWDNTRGLLSVFHGWSVEVSALRLIRSVPLGIDLSHSAVKVLNAMSTRYSDETDGSLEWVVCRPLGATKTRVGFMVVRKGFRLPQGIRRTEILSDLVLEDAFVLESAMRAAFPHTPIISASPEDIELVKRGGVEALGTVA